MLFIAFPRISTKSVELIANFKPRGKCIWLIARVVAQTSVYCIIVPSIRRWRIDFKISELVVGELTNMREVPAKTTKSRKIRIVAERGFWRILLVNQLPLSIMALHAQYRVNAPLKGFLECLERIERGR